MLLLLLLFTVVVVTVLMLLLLLLLLVTVVVIVSCSYYGYIPGVIVQGSAREIIELDPDGCGGAPDGGN